MVLVDAAVVEERQWRRWGGIAALAISMSYLAIIPLFASVGAPPATGEAWFRYLQGKTALWWVIIWLSVITDLLYLAVAQGLWVALRDVAANRMRAAVVCLQLFVVLDLAVTWMHHASLLALFENYASAADDVHRAAYLAAAEYASSIYGTPLLTFYIIVIPSAGVLLAGVTMLRARHWKASAWTGIATGAFGLLSLTGFFPVIMANALGATLWFLLVSRRLLQNGSKETPH